MSHDTKAMLFRVKIGHEEVQVQGRSRADAIREARRKLGVELPRLWDVIQTLRDDQFRISVVR